ncbi:MAG TPA: ABC transporter permease [Gemmatimonadaceae bacterium]|nr:ABC transporter permease [Gemmatimonadaceae bacterium]
MWRAVRALVRKEFLQVFRDPATVVQVFAIPVIQLLILSNAATFDVPRAKLLVIDEDRSSVSAQVIQRLDGSGRFSVVGVQPTEAGIEQAFLDREARVVLRVPPGFARDLARDGRADVALAVDAEDGAAAGILQTAAQAIIADAAHALGTTVAPVITVRTPSLEVRGSQWFNPTRNYKHFMVPGLLVSLTSIIGLLLTSQNIVREKELGTIEQLNVTPLTRTQFLLGKLLPFWILGLVIFTIGLTVGKLVFGIPTRGPVPLVFASAAIYLVVVLGIGLFISTIARTQQQVMFVAFFLLLLFLLLSGIFTPLESAPVWAQRVAAVNPVKYFVFIMRTVLVRGGGLAEVGPTMAGLAVAGVGVMALAVRQYDKRSD